MNLYIPEPWSENTAAALEWWLALTPDARLVYLEATWELEGCETPDDLEHHQRNPRYKAAPWKEPPT